MARRSERGGAAVLTVTLALGLAWALAGCAGVTSRVGPWSCEAAARGRAFVAGDGLDAAFRYADTLRIDTVRAGVRHAYAWQGEGPWAIHVVAVDLTVCGLGLDVRHGGPPLERASGTSSLAAGAVVAVNADFFALPAGTPVGPMVDDGELEVGPGRSWPALAVTTRGIVFGTTEVHGWVRRDHGDGMDDVPYSITRVNRPLPDTGRASTDGLSYHDAWFGANLPADGSGEPTATVMVRRIPDGRVHGVVLRVDTLGRAVPLGRDTVAFRGRGGAADYLRRYHPGDTLAWHADLLVHAHDDLLEAREAVGGFPILLVDSGVPPELATEPRESFGRQRHPRTAVGVARDGRRLWLVTVDGRQAPYSDGMTLAELASLMKRLGATDALNLDGGGSTTMVVEGRIVNRPSDQEGERHVGNALAVIASPGG